MAAADELRVIWAPGQIADTILMAFEHESPRVVGCVVNVDPLVFARSREHGTIVGEFEEPNLIDMVAKFEDAS